MPSGEWPLAPSQHEATRVRFLLAIRRNVRFGHGSRFDGRQSLTGLTHGLRPAGVEHARSLCAIAVLEASGDAESRAVLRTLADGGKESRPASTARAALNRLGEP